MCGLFRTFWCELLGNPPAQCNRLEWEAAKLYAKAVHIRNEQALMWLRSDRKKTVDEARQFVWSTRGCSLLQHFYVVTF
jgi:hypothetical protein